MARTIASIEIKRNCKLLIIILFVCYQSMAQNDSSEITNLPFNSYLIKNNDTLNIIGHKDSIVSWKQIEKIDTLKKWKLIGFKISDSTMHASSEEIFPWRSESNIFRIRDTLPIINFNTLNKQFKLYKSSLGKTSEWSCQDHRFNYWTPFHYNNLLIIKKCNLYIYQAYNRWKTYVYYFEEIE